MKRLVPLLALLCTTTLLPACESPPAREQPAQDLAFDSVLQARVEGAEGIRRVEGSWRLTEQVDPVDGTKNIFIFVPSVFTGPGAAESGLFIRCLGNKTELFITWDEYLSDDPEVTYRIDDSEAVAQTWSVSSDNDATFFPGSPIRFVKEMIGAKTLTAKVTPYRESAIFAQFDLAGLESAVAPIREECQW